MNRKRLGVVRQMPHATMDFAWEGYSERGVIFCRFGTKLFAFASILLDTYSIFGLVGKLA